ncbi:MAG: TonB-dependent receptor [Lewinellaceae bacterium]|nr:TonB-dependent receptor [Lewinella sp.]MCB9278324.1 TonB-dependent receptor [Lewinellaceae bacterium]
MKFVYNALCLNIISIFLLSSGLNAQTVIRGEITDNDTGEPLIGATVLVKSTGEGTVTDFDGAFELRTDEALPVTVVFSYTGYGLLEMDITNTDQPLKIKLGAEAITTEVVEVKGQRISEKQKAAPLTIESLDALAIKQTASDNFYDGLGALKGVDLTAASLGFKIINTRGFNSTSPVRSLQIIDGVDNQSPGLNFSLGNFLGSPELDVIKVDLVVGASSAFYGPGAFNGVVSMETKNPFYTKGLSAMVKFGERSLVETGFRWADAVKNKQGQDLLGYKINFSYLSANDWEATNYDPVYDTRTGVDNPGRYDAVNIYGDEYAAAFDYSTVDLHTYPGIGIFHRTGYKEVDLVDYNTRNIKANASIYLRTNPAKADDSPELILGSSVGTGTTVYQGDNRFSLKNILFYQNRIEFRKRDKFFIRAYSSTEDAGDSYDPYLTALLLQDSAKTNTRWAQDYVAYWQANVSPQIKSDDEFPKLVVMVDPVTGQITATFDRDKALQYLDAHHDDLVRWHSEAEAKANLQSLPTSTVDFYQPGTTRFDEEFREITSKKRTEGGSLFFDKSSLYHVHGEYKFTPSFTDAITVGANARLYTPKSEGTVFYDTMGVKITNFEYGLYTGIEKNLWDKRLKLSAAFRADKNENFDWIFSPAASIVYKPSASNFLRFSFSSAIRNPTLTDQYLFLNVGRATLSGNLDGVQGLADLESVKEFLATLQSSSLKYFDIDPVRPEKVKTFEVGYRTTLFNKLYVDAGYYYNIYDDFLGYNIGGKLTLDPVSGRPTRIRIFRYSANSINQVTTQGFSIGLNYYFKRYYMFSGNYSWNKLNKAFEDDPIIPAFNTPEHKYNLGLSGRDIPLDLGVFRLKNFGFNVNYKWIDGFLFEGSPQFTGQVPSYDLLDVQVNNRFEKLKTTVKIGASNVLDNKQFQAYGGPRIGRLAYISLVYEFQKR